MVFLFCFVWLLVNLFINPSFAFKIHPSKNGNCFPNTNGCNLYELSVSINFYIELMQESMNFREGKFRFFKPVLEGIY